MGLWSRFWSWLSPPEPVVNAPAQAVEGPAPTRSVHRHTRTANRPRPTAHVAVELPAEPSRESASLEAEDEELEAALIYDLTVRCRQLSEALDEEEPDLALLVERLRGEPGDALPQIPAAAQEGLALTVNPDVEVTALVQTFERDPSLAQALLRTANSSYYGFSSPCTSIGKAVVKMGRRGLRNVLLAQIMRGLVVRPGAAFGDMPTEVWAHMSESAPLARRLAPIFGADPEEAFALALLHDAGKLVVFEAASALRRTLRREVQVQDPTLIGRCLDLLHEPLGGLAVLKWGFGPEVARVVAHHHRRPAPKHVRSPLSETIYLADKLELAGDVSTANLEAIWARGRLSGDPARVSELPTDTWSRRALVEAGQA
ncbi:MAG: HDOD domain-containing protein [Planctomycetota bacterium]